MITQKIRNFFIDSDLRNSLKSKINFNSKLDLKSKLDLRSRKNRFLLIALLIVFTSSIVFFLKQEDPQQAEVSVEHYTVRRDDIKIDLSADGSIEYAKVNLGFDVKGTLREVLVKEGEKVLPGDIIARLEDEAYHDEYLLAAAKLKDANNQLELSYLDSTLKLKQAKESLDTIQAEYELMQEIPDAFSTKEIEGKKQELENKELEYKKSLLSYEYLKSDHENIGRETNQNEISVKMASENLDNTVLYSPVEGLVLSINGKAGETVSENAEFAVVQENNKVKASTMLIEYDISQIYKGQKVYVSVDALEGETLIGEVSHVDLLPTKDNSGIVNYKVEIDILQPSPDLRDGMTCLISFILKEVKDVLIVPYQAIRIVNGKQTVDVLDSNGTVTVREVKTGFTDGKSVEVMEGLNVNDTVLVYRSR